MFLDLNRDGNTMLDTSIQRDLQETTRQLENQLKEEKTEKDCRVRANATIQ